MTVADDRINNMALWNRVKTTDPKHTKKVEFGRKFTAIDAMYQIQSATEQFGEVGKGWGWSFSDPLFPPNGTVVIKCTLWHGVKENTIEHFGQKSMEFKGKPDEDAFKKAATDGLTKCLSYLGFNADVFLGLFDDNKYVESLADGKIEAGVLDEDMRKEADDMFIEQMETAFDLCQSSSDVEKVITSRVKKSLGKLSKSNNAAFLKLQSKKNALVDAFNKIEEEVLNQFNNA